MIQRKIDERTSLLTEEYIHDKYPEDNFYIPPSTTNSITETQETL